MTNAELEQRICSLERELHELKSTVANALATCEANGTRRWWVDDAGRFADDPMFDEMVRLTRECRSRN